MRKLVDIGVSGAIFLLIMCLAPADAAEGFVDPTRPPTARDDSDATAASSTPVLQSVLIGQGRTEAIISGQTVKLGEKFGDAQVVKITETEVVLRNGTEIRTIRLFPNIEKRLIYNRTGGSPGKRETEK